MNEEIERIEKALKESSERLREFRKVDAKEQILAEMSYRQELFEQLINLKEASKVEEKDTDIKEYKKLNLKKIEYFNISFDAMNLLYNVTYRINGKDGSLYTRLNNNLSSSDKMVRDVAVSKLVDANFFNIFDGFNPEKIKNYDAKLIAILYSKFSEVYGDQAKGVEACRAYLKQLELGKNADKSKLPYTIKYNLKSIFKSQFNDGKKLSFINKIRFLKMIKANRYVATVEPERRINKRWVALLAALGIGAGALALHSGKTQNEQHIQKENKNAIVDTLEEQATKETIVQSSSKQQNQWNEESIEKENNSWSLSQETLKEIQEHMNKFKENQENLNKNNQEELKFGSVMKLKEGLQFTESVFGGRVGTVGEESSPKEGFYVIDHVAEISDTAVSNRYGLSGKIEKNDENSKQYFHVSYVEGAKTLEEAQKIIDEQNKNIKDRGVADKNIVKPRGWVSQETIEKIFKEQKNNQLENEQEK